MKRSKKTHKLNLNRETLRDLETSTFARPAGGRPEPIGQVTIDLSCDSTCILRTCA